MTDNCMQLTVAKCPELMTLIKVCSQGGLKHKQLENLLRQYNPDKVIAHFGVNNIEFKSEEDILDKFANISDSFYDMTKLSNVRDESFSKYNCIIVEGYINIDTTKAKQAKLANRLLKELRIT